MTDFSWNIIGHDAQTQLLETDFLKGNLAHSYIFSGPANVGKYSVAREFARMLQGGTLQIVDLIEVNEDMAHSVKIDQIRKVVDRMAMSKQSLAKVVLVKNAERLTTEAANSFLKFLEEPPNDTYIILTTNQLSSLLPTIRSRARLVSFALVNEETLKKGMQKYFSDISENDISELAAFAEGRAGKLISLLKNEIYQVLYKKFSEKVEQITSGLRAHQKFSLVEELLEEKDNLPLFLEIMTWTYRKKLLSEKDPVLKKKYLELLGSIENSGNLIMKNVNSRLVLDNLLLEI